MNKVEQVVNDKKLSYFLTLLWTTLTIHTWAPFIGKPAGEKFIPIWQTINDANGNIRRTELTELLPSTGLYPYSLATIISVITIWLFLQSILKSNSSIAKSFPKYFIYLMLFLALSGGWYEIKDYDTEVFFQVIRVFVLGIFEGLNSDTETQLYELIFSLTFWVVVLRIVFNKTSRSSK
jgi:hypothetical protein